MLDKSAIATKYDPRDVAEAGTRLSHRFASNYSRLASKCGTLKDWRGVYRELSGYSGICPEVYAIRRNAHRSENRC